MILMRNAREEKKDSLKLLNIVYIFVFKTRFLINYLIKNCTLRLHIARCQSKICHVKTRRNRLQLVRYLAARNFEFVGVVRVAIIRAKGGDTHSRPLHIESSSDHVFGPTRYSPRDTTSGEALRFKTLASPGGS